MGSLAGMLPLEDLSGSIGDRVRDKIPTAAMIGAPGERLYRLAEEGGLIAEQQVKILSLGPV